MERVTRFELATSSLARKCSTTELHPLFRDLLRGRNYWRRSADRKGKLFKMSLSNRLQQIVDYKRTEVEKILPRAELLRLASLERNDFRSLYTALKRMDEGSTGVALVAEVKKASPTAGTIKEDFNALDIAREYDRQGASAISVLTDKKFFKGDLSYLTEIRREVSVPCLRKDFILHEAQIWEAAVAGADAVLLIVACLGQEELVHLLDVTQKCGLEALVEVHDREEMERALETDAKIIGVNNRNLKTFEVDLKTTELLSEEVPDDVVLVSESGIRGGEDARMVEEWGADAVLVGEALMRSGKVGDTVKEIMGGRHPQANVV